MDSLSFASVTSEVLDEVAKDIISRLSDSKIILFYGEMGAGKTTLIKEICKQLDVTETMSSPTFSVVNEYHTTNNAIIYHFDLYRIKNIEECFDLGMEEYIYSGHYCFIEWPEMALPLLPERYYRVHIKSEKDNTRSINFR
jgi:tRNA threonylcarbamoyladenosine biosynthesis protein TsaE